MANQHYQSMFEARDPLLIEQVLAGEAMFHKKAVDIARHLSGFEDERAIHAFAVTISIAAQKVLNTPELKANVDDWYPHDLNLDNIADLHQYARHAHLHPMLAFVGLVCQEWDIEPARVKEVLKGMFNTPTEFNIVSDYVALANEVSKEAALSEEARIALGAE